MKPIFALLFLTVFFYSGVYAQAQTIWTGLPSIKISEGGIDRTPEKISQKDAVNLKCIISRIDNKYYWASRGNKELLRIESGSFITFVSHEGAGYIRVLNFDLKDVTSLMGDTETEFDYVEHMLIGLRSVTYYGKKTQ